MVALQEDRQENIRITQMEIQQLQQVLLRVVVAQDIITLDKVVL
jgi:hypothetical protein|tara:strand:- start:272 stop:403 length:132 start_codon:yes stop_codon:yes gene_type:complete